MRLKRGSAARPSSPGLTLVGCRSGVERRLGDMAASMAGAAGDVKAGGGMCCPSRASLKINASPMDYRRHSPKSVAGLSGSSVLNVMLQDWFHSFAPARLGNSGLVQAGCGDIEDPFAVECVLEAYGDTRAPLHCQRNAGRVRRSEGHDRHKQPFASTLWKMATSRSASGRIRSTLSRTRTGTSK
jgi:hypothetical protein